MIRQRVLILGAGGRDFHNFNVVFRNNPAYEVVGFTATQIPHIENRIYPFPLSGPLYPQGISIYPEDELPVLIETLHVDEAVFSYSDVSFNTVMTRGSVALAKGARFSLLGARQTMLQARKPVIAVVAVRTGSGKSQTSRKVTDLLREAGKKVAVVRHPMPYGDLEKQRIQRFATVEDFEKYHCTLEEIEEYEQHVLDGHVVYAGVDYAEILEEAQKEADLIVWDGGNNDFPFFKPDLWITVADPHRAGNEISYHPGMVNFLSADVIIINKVDTADPLKIQEVQTHILRYNPGAKVILAESPIHLATQDNANPEQQIRGKKVLAIEDGPTVTHGEMLYGAAVLAARSHGAQALVDPRPYAVGSIHEAFERYPHTGTLLPAMGYSPTQLKDLEETIRRTPCDTVLIGTPVDLRRILTISKPCIRITYDLQEKGKPDLSDILSDVVRVSG